MCLNISVPSLYLVSIELRVICECSLNGVVCFFHPRVVSLRFNPAIFHVKSLHCHLSTIVRKRVFTLYQTEHSHIGIVAHTPASHRTHSNTHVNHAFTIRIRQHFVLLLMTRHKILYTCRIYHRHFARRNIDWRHRASSIGQTQTT